MSDSDLKKRISEKSTSRKPQKLQLGEKVFVNTGQHGYHLARIVIGSEERTDLKGRKMYLVQWDSTRGKQYVVEDTIDWITRGNDMLDKVKAQSISTTNEPRRFSRSGKGNEKLKKRPTRLNVSVSTEDDKKRQTRSSWGQQQPLGIRRSISSQNDSLSEDEINDESDTSVEDTTVDHKPPGSYDSIGYQKQSLKDAMTSGQCTDSAADVPSDMEILHQASKRLRHSKTTESSCEQIIHLENSKMSSSAPFSTNTAPSKNTTIKGNIGIEISKLMNLISEVGKLKETKQTNLKSEIEQGKIFGTEKIMTSNLLSNDRGSISQEKTKEHTTRKQRSVSIVPGFTVYTQKQTLNVADDFFIAPLAMQNTEKNKSVYYYCGYSSFYGKYQQFSTLYQYGCYTWLSDVSEEVDCDILYLKRSEIVDGLAVQRFIELNQSQIPKEYTCTGRL